MKACLQSLVSVLMLFSRSFATFLHPLTELSSSASKLCQQLQLQLLQFVVRFWHFSDRSLKACMMSLQFFNNSFWLALMFSWGAHAASIVDWQSSSQ